ncbi:unnamed protein product, partial [Iphiclides podalirius]
MSDREGPAVPFAAGMAVGAVLTALGFKLFSKCPKPCGQTHQIGAKPKCVCEKGGKDDREYIDADIP